MTVTIPAQTESTDRARVRVTMLVAVAAVLIILFIRRPDAILHPAFWAEDGAVWYADAYNMGWRSLLMPHAGYLNLVQRLVALFAQAFPLSLGPAIFVSAATLIQLTPSIYLICNTPKNLAPSQRAGILAAMLYALAPNSHEVLLNLTNASVHLACTAFLILLSAHKKGPLAFMFLFLSGLSGPFCILLVPVAIWTWIGSGNRYTAGRCCIVLGCAALQAALIAEGSGTVRSSAPLGAGLAVLLDILAVQLFLGGLLGSHVMTVLTNSAMWSNGFASSVIGVGGILLSIVAFRLGSSSVRKAVLWGALMSAAALLLPQASENAPQWPTLTRIGAGNRYFFVPILAWIVACISLQGRGEVMLRRAATCLIVFLVIGVASDIPHRREPSTGYEMATLRFEQLPDGTTMSFPARPASFPPMILTKRPWFQQP